MRFKRNGRPAKVARKSLWLLVLLVTGTAWMQSAAARYLCDLSSGRPPDPDEVVWLPWVSYCATEQDMPSSPGYFIFEDYPATDIPDCAERGAEKLRLSYQEDYPDCAVTTTDIRVDLLHELPLACNGNVSPRYYIGAFIEGYEGTWEIACPGSEPSTRVNSYGDKYYLREPVGGGELIEPRNFGEPRCGLAAGNPINIATGNKYQQMQDVVLPDGLQIVRHYNSRDAGQRDFGPGWRGGYSRHIELVGARESGRLSLALTRDDGRVDYWRIEQGISLPPPDARGILEAVYSDDRLDGFTYRETGLVETYDPSGRLQSIEDDAGGLLLMTYQEDLLVAVTARSGRSLIFVRDGLGRIERVTAPDGAEWEYRYDPQGRLHQVVHPGGGAEQYHYEDASNPNALTGLSDGRNIRVRSWAYDAQGRAVLSARGGPQSPAGRYTVSYNADGSAVTTGPLQHSVEHGFEIDHGVARFALASAPRESCVDGASSISRDSHGNRDIVTDFSGHHSDFDYSPDNLLLRVTEGVGTPQQRQKTYAWDAMVRKPTRIDEKSRLIEYRYNSRGQVLTRTIIDSGDGHSRTWTYEYFEAPVALIGRLRSVDGPRIDVSDVTRYEYYESDHAGGLYRSGDLRSVTNPLGQQTTWLAYDANGRPLLLSDANGVQTALSWLPRGWLASQEIDGAVTSFTYDEAGNLLRVTGANGAHIDYRYDELNRLVEVVDPVGNRIEYALDEMGHRVAERNFDAAGELRRSLGRQYDGIGRLVRLIDGLEAGTSFEYDSNGNQTAIIDAGGRRTELIYDALNRLTGIIDAARGETTALYDEADRLIQVTDPAGQVTGFSYDGLGNLIEVHSPDSGLNRFEYDEGGNRVRAVDARGIERSFFYDALNRLLQISFADSAFDVRFDYDDGLHAVGRLSRMYDAAGAVDYQYDRRGNLIREVREIGLQVYETAYSYDMANQLIQIQYPGGLVIDRVLNGAGRTASLIGPDGVLADEVRYEPFGPLRSFRYGNGTTYEAERGPDYAVSRVHSGPQLDWRFSRDAGGRILSVDDANGAELRQDFGYDPRGRLKSANGAYGTLAFAYDANGNRTRYGAGTFEELLDYEPASNRLLAQGPWRFQRDAAGNRVEKADGTGSGQAYLFAGDGRLAGVSLLQDGAESILASYLYNGFGRRVVKESDGLTTHFVYLPDGRLLGEYALGADRSEREYVYLAGAPLAVVSRDVRSVTPPGVERIVDNGDPGTAATGSWRVRKDSDAWGTDFLLANRAAGSFYRWSTSLPPIDYRLYAWWSGKNTQSQNVVYNVFDGSGVNRTTARSQKTGGGRWELLGEFHTDGGANAVEIRSGENRFVADAIRWQEMTAPVLQFEEQWHYLHFDHVATPRRVTDRDQAVVWSWDSTPFGRGLADEDPDGDGRPFTLNLRFAGQYHDAESGLSYHHFRSYDPAIGRFLEADPIGLEGGINPFVYAENQPMALTDPLGLFPSGEWLRRPRFNISDYGITGVDAIAPYLDEWGFLKVFRVHGYASGYVNLDVRCEDRDGCSPSAWEVHRKIGLSYGAYKDLGPNLVAAGAGTAAGPLAGAATGIVTLGGSAMMALLDILREVEARGGDKLRWVWELGPTAFCLASTP